MPKAQSQCPSCGSRVDLGGISCRYCGVNLKSGESFEARVKKARGKAVHPEHFGGSIYVSVVLAFSLFIFAGFMYQKIVEKTIGERSDVFQPAVQMMEQLDDLVAAANQKAAKGDQEGAQEDYRKASKRMQEFIQWLTSQCDAIKLETPYAKETEDRYSGRYGRQEPKYNKRVAKALLNNLKAKAEDKLSRIPTT